MVIFLYKFARNRKFWGSTDKVEYRCTTTNLLLCSDTITLLRSVSVVTNFVIPKHDKQKNTDKKHHTFWSTAGARPTIPTILGMVIEEVCTIFEPPKFFHPTSSFAAKGIENLWENATTAGDAYNSVDLSPKNDQIKYLKPA